MWVETIGSRALPARGPSERIIAVGTTADITRLAGPRTTRIDLHGRSVVPGLIDNHMHLLRAGTTWAREVRLDGVTSRRQAVDRLTARARAIPAGDWVYTMGGWSVDQFADSRAPFTREELDRIAPTHPLAIQESYYRTYLNSKGLEALGIRDGAPNPSDFPPNTIRRDAAGKATGIVEGGMGAVFRATDMRLSRTVAVKVLSRDLLPRRSALL